MKTRTSNALLEAYKSAVMVAARERGIMTADFGKAAAALPPEEFERLRAAFALQMAKL